MTLTSWHRIDRALRTTTTVHASCAVSFALSLFFIFVWSPLPWGWQGIDGYREMALSLARGESFATIHVPWGYPYFVAFWFWVGGDLPWLPLLAQAALNASLPYLLYRLASLEIGPRVGVMSAVLAALLSFNTAYTAALSTDSVCTVLVVAAVYCFALGRAQGRLRYFAASGVLASFAFQFRPNFVLFPFYAAALYMALGPSRQKARQMLVFVLVFLGGATPWVVRNYRWSGQFVPASTHGGIQLWFGSLQTGPYQENWIYNPRAAFERPPVDYSSIDEMPPVVSGLAGDCGPVEQTRVELVYWTNHNPTPVRVAATLNERAEFVIPLPRMPSPTAVSYYFDTWHADRGGSVFVQTPKAGAADPLRFTLSRDHLGDLDITGQAFDVFDLARLARHLAWGDGPAEGLPDLDADGAISDADLLLGATWLGGADPDRRTPMVVATGVTHDAAQALIAFADGSTLAVPRVADGRITNLLPVGPTTATVVSRSRSFAGLRAGRLEDPMAGSCLYRVGINQVPNRRLPHEMRRFIALALDNIAREPLAYLQASAFRAVRVFVVGGATDRRTAAQFSGSAIHYRAAGAVGVLVLGLFLAGLAVALARGLHVFMLLMPIVYVPATISFMLINARYSVTIQPFMFVFVAILLVTLMDWAAGRAGGARHASST